MEPDREAFVRFFKHNKNRNRMVSTDKLFNVERRLVVLLRILRNTG